MIERQQNGISAWTHAIRFYDSVGYQWAISEATQEKGIRRSLSLDCARLMQRMLMFCFPLKYGHLYLSNEFV